VFDNDVVQAPNIRQPVMRGKGNTGPKGVLADYAEHRELKRIEYELKNLKNEWQMKKLAMETRVTARREAPKVSEDKEYLVVSSI
jgi:hypothetical protein